MFKAANPYDEIIAKATDEKQTEVNWDTLLSVWDKVAEEGETGARNAVQAIQKRLQHRSANVQLFSLTLAGALVNNCGPPLHREISSKAFTQALVRLVNDRTTHDDVKKQTLKSINDWVKEHPNNTDFDLMADTYDQLKNQGLRFEGERPKSPPRRSDDALKREEEDLQRALAESAALADPRRGYTPSKALPDQPSTQQAHSQPDPAPLRSNSSSAPKRVRALYNFAPQTSEELGFQAGDLISVIECVYEAWWKGELRGSVGIFPANHVEAVPDEVDDGPGGRTEAEVEGELFAQAGMVDKLLVMMRGLSGQGKNVADNDELIELYQKSMALRPKVVKLIERYEQKQAELESMNQKFARAASTYEAIVGRQQQQQQQQQYQQHQPQPAYHNGAYAQPQAQAQPQPGPSQYHDGHGQPQQGDPYAGWTEQQRREYDAQWAAYHQQMAEYEKAQADYQRQQAALQQQQQQQGQPQDAHQGPDGVHQGGAGVEPQWDGHQWAYPNQQQQQHAQQSLPAQGLPQPEHYDQPPPPAAQASSPPPAPAAAYHNSNSTQRQAPHPEQAPPASYPAQPYPDVSGHAPPPPQPPPAGAYGLTDQMAALSVNGQHAAAPASVPEAAIEYHHHAPPQDAPLQQYPAYTGEPQHQAPQGGYPTQDPHYPGAPQPWAGQQ